MELNLLLAGPVLRRVERDRAYVWLATSRPAAVVAEVYRTGDGSTSDQRKRIGGGPAESIRLGERLFIHLARATPSDNEWPGGELLEYDLRLAFVDGDEPVMTLSDFGLLEGPNTITYGSSSLPTFFVPESAPLRVVHGSCRLLHGRGEDALAVADEAVAERYDDLDTRPTALFLTGDQIYADDVASPLIGHVRELATALMGEADDTSVPGVDRLSDIAPGDRQDVVRDKASFTSAHCDNHLMSMGEFAAMYACAWNHENWPATWPKPGDEARGKQTSANAIRSRRTWLGQTKALERARVALPAVRRLLANVPTYMVFDDHDVTDDWNLTKKWVQEVRSTPTGTRIVANALASFWAFQGWGNNPDEFDDDFKAVIAEHVVDSRQHDSGQKFDEMLWGFDRWSFCAPTTPPIICADTRTQRGFDADDGAARLIGKEGLRRIKSLAESAGITRDQPLLLVSPVPVFGFELQERRQKYLVSKVGPYEIDFEAWHSNLRGLVDLMKVVVEEIQPSQLVLLSGDVHYGVNARAAFRVGDREVPMVQLVSSGLKHAGVLASSGIEALGHLLRPRHERWGWEEPPEPGRFTPLKDFVLERPVNTDEWSGVSPVFVAPRDARLLAIDQEPDYRECRVYVRPEEERASLLMGINNVGFVSLSGDRIEHRLMGRARDELEVRTAAIDSGDGSLFD